MPRTPRAAPGIALAALAILSCSLVAGCLLAGCKARRGNETVDCTPGSEIWIGCNQACDLGSCSGDPWIQVCDGDVPVTECNDETLIAENDDARDICHSTCPIVQMVCPDSGHVTVTVRAYSGRGNTQACDWRLEERRFRSFVDAGAAP